MAQHPVTGSLEFQESLEIAVTEEQVAAYRETGDTVIGHTIVKTHIRIVLGMAGRRASRKHDFEELVSVGLTALTQAVVWSGPHLNEEGQFEPSRLIDNNITPYLKSTIKSWMKRFIEEDRVVYMPGRTFRYKAATNQIDPSGRNTAPEIVGVVSLSRLVVEDNESDEQFLHHETPVAIPLARQEEPDCEIEEALELAIVSDRERRVIDLRREGYGYVEIHQILGLSKSTIGNIVNEVESRFIKLYG